MGQTFTPLPLRDDTANANLNAACGLRGSEGLDVAQSLRVIDEWAGAVWRDTNRVAHLFDSHPSETTQT
jgi:hypothetical protein